MKTSLHECTFSFLESWLSSHDFSPKHAPLLSQMIFRENVLSEHPNLSPKLISVMSEQFETTLPEISTIHESSDGTYKFMIRFEDKLEVEAVLIPFHHRYTICLSTQVGCAMNCQFCYTGLQGLKRNLKASEIVGEYLAVSNWWKNKNPEALLPNIVFMGQGEPLHNVDEVKKAIEVFINPHGIGLGPRQMTLSTAGYLPGIKKLADFAPINIALSLHSPFEEERTELIPINKSFPLSEILPALLDLPKKKRQFLTLEYLLIKDFNMSDLHVERLSELFSGEEVIFNLIPFNPFPEARFERPDPVEIDLFKEKLVSKNLRVMVRTTKGDDILAACGQLHLEKLKTRKNVNR
jgi:23S rRNA (adenine2503-C2)-methyltransferase